MKNSIFLNSVLQRSVFLILLTIGLAGCDDDCMVIPYRSYSIEIFTQSIPKGKLPQKLEVFLKPIDQKYISKDGYCFCPTNGFEGGDGGTPYVTISRVDSTNSMGSPHKLLLVQGTSELATYGEFYEKIDLAIERISLPASFGEEPKPVSRSMIESKIVGGYKVFFLNTVSVPDQGDSLRFSDGYYQVFGNASIVKDSISKYVHSYYSENSQSRSEEDISNDFGPKIAIFYNLDVSEVEEPVFPRIIASRNEGCERSSFTFNDKSLPLELMKGGEWNFGDNSPKLPYKGVSVMHRFEREGEFTVSLCDASGQRCGKTVVKVNYCEVPLPCGTELELTAIPLEVKLGKKVKVSDKSKYLNPDACSYRRIWWVDNRRTKEEGGDLEVLFDQRGSHTIRLCIDKETPASCKEVTIEVKSNPLNFAINASSIQWNSLGKGVSYMVSIKDTESSDFPMPKTKLTTTKVNIAEVNLVKSRRYRVTVQDMETEESINKVFFLNEMGEIAKECQTL